MTYAAVVIDVPTRALEQAFTYAIPVELEQTCQVGCCVLVDFAHRKQLGYVTGIEQEPPPGKLKALEQVLCEPLFTAAAADLAQWIASEYAAALSEALRLFLPPGAAHRLQRGSGGSWELVRPVQHAVEDVLVTPTSAAVGAKLPANATRQIALLKALASGALLKSELSLEFSGVGTIIAALAKRGLVEVHGVRKLRGRGGALRPDAPIVDLTAGQRYALDAISDAGGRGSPAQTYSSQDIGTVPGTFGDCATRIRPSAAGITDSYISDSCDANVIVLDGVTGSGKTEVYLQAIAKVLAAGGSAIVLVPEISLTPQTVSRFRARFGSAVAVLHSRLSQGERYDQWDMVRMGAASVVVGARSALFAPVRNLKLIVIDEEHDSSYKQGSSPRYHARDVAVRYAQITGATVVLGSATPSVETLCQCAAADDMMSESESAGVKQRATARWRRVVLPQRTGAFELPKVEVIDLAAEFKAKNNSMFSRVLRQELLATIERGEKAVLLLNRRGFASFLLCRDCGFVPECEDCATSLTYHLGKGGGILKCHHCGAEHPAPVTCPECGSPYLKQLGKGTQFVAKELESILPEDTPVVRMDADTTKGKDAHERLLEQFIAAPNGVLLGTQMIAKGLDFPDVTLVGVMLADTALRLPDFRAPERTYQLLEQVAGRAGRADKPGKVVVQSYMPEHVAIRAAAAHERDLLYNSEFDLRAQLGYPPYRRFANILAWGPDFNAVAAQAQALVNILGEQIADLEDWLILGPNPCVFSKRKKDYRWHIVLSAPAGAAIGAVARAALKKLKRAEDVRTSIDVDPYDLL